MISLGILTLHPKIRSNYITNIGKHSKKYNITVYRFHPLNWNPKTNEVVGEVFDHVRNHWKTSAFPLPTFIYDRCYYTEAQHKDEFSIVKTLKQKAHFLSTGLPNKWTVYQTLSRIPKLARFLPTTIKATNSEEIINQLQQNQRLVLKPIRGAHGKGIFFITEIDAKQIFIQTHWRGLKKTATMSTKQFAQWFSTLNKQNQSIVQHYLNLTNEHAEPFDIRILIQKKTSGKWQEIGRGIRLGKQGNFVSNIHNGGKIFSYDLFTRHLQQRDMIEKQIDEIVNLLPAVLDNQFGRLFELGIDIGVEKATEKCWLLEANSKPGYRTILPALKVNSLSEHPLSYCLYLHQLQLKGAVLK